MIDRSFTRRIHSLAPARGRAYAIFVVSLVLAAPAFAQRSTPVKVTNSEDEPVPVEESGRQPFSRAIFVDYDAGDLLKCEDVPIPDDKALELRSVNVTFNTQPTAPVTMPTVFLSSSGNIQIPVEQFIFSNQFTGRAETTAFAGLLENGFSIPLRACVSLRFGTQIDVNATFWVSGFIDDEPIAR